MNEKAMTYIKSLGALVETWLVVYNNFTKQGLNDADALAHTREFMKAFMSASISGNGEGETK